MPLGEIDDVLVMLAAGLPNLRLVYQHKTSHGQYRFDTEAIREIIGDFQDSNLEIRKFLKEMIVENLQAIQAEY